MPPVPVSFSSARDRSTTTRAASSSAIAPAAQAAAISPWEWPSTAAGSHAGRAPQRGQRHHHREQRRLDHVRAGQFRRALGAGQHVESPTSRCAGATPRRSSRNWLPKTGLASIRSAAMPAHCAALAGEDEHRVHLGRRLAGDHAPDAPCRPPAPPARRAARPGRRRPRPRGARTLERAASSCPAIASCDPDRPSATSASRASLRPQRVWRCVPRSPRPAANRLA